MSILIKGMEMPKEGTVIAIYKLNGKFYASVHGTELCPLIEVPPHGRLIDADVMIKRYEPDMNRQIYGGNFIFDLEHAPTVIPADKDGE